MHNIARRAGVPIVLGLAVAVLSVFAVNEPGRAQDGELPFRMAIPGVASDRPEHPVEAPLREAERQWAASGIDDYAIVVAVRRYGLWEDHALLVRDGAVTSIESECSILGNEPYACPDGDPARYTVQGLFETIHFYLVRSNPTPPVFDPEDPGVAAGEWILEAEFSGPYGVPSRIAWGLFMVYDSDTTLTVEAFSRLP